MHKKIILQKTINWFYKTIFTSKKYSSRQLEPSGKSMSCKGASMAQSSGDGKLPRTGPRPVTITTQQNPFPRGSLSWFGHLRRGGLSLAVALRTQGAITISTWFFWAIAGVRSCATQSLELLRRIGLSRSLVPALKRSMAFRVLTFIAPWAHVMPSTCWLPIGPLGASVHRGEI